MSPQHTGDKQTGTRSDKRLQSGILLFTQNTLLQFVANQTCRHADTKFTHPLHASLSVTYKQTSLTTTSNY